MSRILLHIFSPVSNFSISSLNPDQLLWERSAQWRNLEWKILIWNTQPDVTWRSLRGNDMDNSLGGRSRLTFSVHSAPESDNTRSKRFTCSEAPSRPLRWIVRLNYLRQPAGKCRGKAIILLLSGCYCSGDFV